MSKSAILAVRIVGDAASAVQALGDTEQAAGGVSAVMPGLAAGAGVALGALTAAAAGLTSMAEEAGTANARIEQISSQMLGAGDAAEQVSARAIEAAESMARITGIDPNVIKQGQATLLTFGEIAATADQVGGTFDRATTLAADLSAAGFGSVESAATLLGKALNDPIKGVSALARVGVTLTDAQKEQVAAMVEAGDMAAAQGVILAAVEQQVGGVAEATANGSDKMAVAWQLAQEKLGEKLLPAMTKLFDMGIQLADWAAEHSDLILALGSALGVVSGIILAIAGAMKVYAAVQAIQTAAQWAQNAAWLANPIVWIVLAIIAAIALVIGIIWLLANNWDQVVAWISNAWQTVTAAIASFWETHVVQPIDRFVGWIQSTVALAILGWQIVWQTVTAAIAGFIDTWIVTPISTVVTWLTSNVRNAIEGVKSWFQDLASRAAAVWESIIGWIRQALNWLGKIINSAVPPWVKDVANMVFTAEIEPVTAAGVPLARSGLPAMLTLDAAPGLQFAARRPALPGGLDHGARPPAGEVHTYQITINGAVDPVETGKQLERILRRYRGARGVA